MSAAGSGKHATIAPAHRQFRAIDEDNLPIAFSEERSSRIFPWFTKIERWILAN